MREIKWNDGWKFWPNKDSFALVWDVPEIARDITLPHDAMIENPANPDSPNGGNTGFRDGEVYNYVKLFNVPDEDKNKQLMLKFEGVYMNAFVYVNGQLAAKNMSGYTTFYAPLNNFLKYDAENEVRVQVRAGAMTNSRWYSGAGIYRDVYLLEGAPLAVKPEGVQINTETIQDEYAVINVSAEVENKNPAASKIVLKTEIFDEEGKVSACDEVPVVLFANSERKQSRRISISAPKLWSENTPYLYSYKCTIFDENKENVIDAAEGTFGIRTLTVDSKNGIRVNGETVKLRGACIHHDSGLLGAATYEDAQYRQVKKLKEAGFNAIRMSHHPMAPAMLRACDKLGVFVMDEVTDIWTRCKSDYDYGMSFTEQWPSDVKAMVRKDYNCPSVILYSIGNEIPEIGTPLGAEIAHKMCEEIKALDDTRLTLASINGVFAAGDAVGQIISDVVAELAKEGKMDGNVNDFMTLMDGHMDEIVVHKAISDRLEMACASTDIAGYNYMTARYEGDGINYPDRVIVGSETYPPEIARNWDLVEKLPHVVGDFTWTGWDYIGEAGVGIPAYEWGEGGFGARFPAQLAYCGDIDITGFRRPASYFREAVFGLSRTPYIAVQNPEKYGQFLIKTPWVISDAISSWTYEGYEGKPVVVEVYAQGTEVELIKNGVSLGRKPSGKAAGFRTLFETTYEPGTLTAIAYDSDAEISRFELKTAGSEKELHLSVEDEKYGCDGLIYINADLTDENGTVITADEKLTLTSEGDVEILGFGSGNPKTEYNYNEGVTKTWNGHALIIARKTGEGKAIITVTSESGLKEMAAL